MRVSSFALAATASLAAAQNVVSHCAPANNGVCFSMHVPSGEDSMGPGDIHMQIVAPATIPWVGLGQSPEGMMMGANMFVVYQSMDGKNLTVSNRAGHGHVPPKPSHDSNVTLLKSSGIKDGKMVANLRCSNCNQWEMAGEMNLADSKSMWIYAYAPHTGKTIHNSSTMAAISIHEGYGVFKADLKSATGGASSSDPFATRAVPTTGSQGTKQVTYSDPQLMVMQSKARLAHAVLGGLAFGLFFPIGAILMRLGVLGAKSTWKLHAGIQLFAYLMVFGTMGTGIWLARGLLMLDTTHAKIGLVATSGVGILPFLGVAQHYLFTKSRGRTLVGHAHAYLGRAFIILGIVNLPIGLWFAEPYQPVKVMKGRIAYSVIVGVIGITWMAVVAVTAVQRRMRSRKQDAAVVESSLPTRQASEDTEARHDSIAKGMLEIEKGIETGSNSDRSR